MRFVKGMALGEPYASMSAFRAASVTFIPASLCARRSETPVPSGPMSLRNTPRRSHHPLCQPLLRQS